MIKIIIATVVAIVAINTQATPPPTSFTDTVLDGRPVATERFVGLKAKAPDGEVWYAGLKNGKFVTGP